MELQSSSLLLFISLSLLIFRVLKIGLWSKSNRLNPNLPPGPWKLPIIGSLHHLFGPLPHRALRNLARKYGPLMHLQLGEVTLIVVSSPKLAKEVMKTHDINFASRPKVLGPRILTYGCTGINFSPYGEYWRQLRKIGMLELFSTKRIQSSRWIREEEASKLIQRITSNVGSPINLTEHLFSLAYTNIFRTAVGRKSTLQDPERFVKLINAALLAGSFAIEDTFPSYTFLRFISRTRSKVERLHREIDSILDNIITEHREAGIKTTGTDEDREDLIDALLTFEKRDNQGFSLSTSNIKAVIFDLFAAGGDTPQATLDWAMAEMIKNLTVLEKAQAEVRWVFKRQGGVREDGLSDLKYLKLVIKEVLRLHPPVTMLLPRECGERCEINGFEIPEKATVLIHAWAIGRDPEYWDEPETFDPERFLNSPIDHRGNNFEYIPFGAGRRMCPSMNLGLAFVEYQLATLLYHFDWKLPDGMKNEDLDMTETFSVVIRRKHDLYLIPTPYHP
ncbi:hypothetical protein CDL15_Pgr012069 [Punica granatum]|uniref:Cytochrome P450 71D9-like n=1 Tax=Punica granatum TaxID=22663 RepID=A0A218XMB6_PUNGR|nr:hypothetical protein CDL15_Pgr012069 [Punica granatum]